LSPGTANAGGNGSIVWAALIALNPSKIAVKTYFRGDNFIPIPFRTAAPSTALVHICSVPYESAIHELRLNRRIRVARPEGLGYCSGESKFKKDNISISRGYFGRIFRTCGPECFFCFEGRRVVSAWHMLIKMG
jgi:hypothetical protein